MVVSALKEIRKIYSSVNADEIRSLARHELTVGLIASGEAGFRAIEDFLGPAGAAKTTRTDALVPAAFDFDFILVEPGIPLPPKGYTFDVTRPSDAMRKIADDFESRELALACGFAPFRHTVADNIISRISRENALCALVTALPNIIPSVLDLPWALGEFATDTAFLTMNQIRMALLMAAAHDRIVGYRQQKMEIAAIAGGAFGWRALARELVGKIPLGGGLIPKAAVAFAGTYVVGLGLEKINRNGEGLSKWERREAYAAALDTGKEVARSMAAVFTKRS